MTSKAFGLAQLGNAYSDGALSNRNKVINGAMTIDQRNAGAAVTVDGASGYSLDRYFSAEIGDGAFTVQQVSDAPSGFSKSLKVTVTTAQTGTLNAVTLQAIEGFNIADLGWGTASASPVTLSFWVKSSVTGTLGGALQNSPITESYPFTYTVSAADTWEYKTVNIAGPTTGTWASNNSTGITLRFTHGTSTTGTAGAWATADTRGPTGATYIITTSGATWQITGVQLEAGDTATPFEHRSYGQELALCQRYFQFVGGHANSFPLWQSYYVSGNFAVWPMPFKAEMRASPTSTIVGTWQTVNLSSLVILYTNNQGFSIGGNVSSTAMVEVYPNSSDDRLTFSAEL